MSGPKSYSVHIFDKHLRQIFELNCEIQLLISDLKEKKLTDEVRGIHYENEDFIEKGKKDLEVLMEIFKPSNLEKLNQSQFNQYYNQFSETSQKMQVLKNGFLNEIARFDNIQTSYQAYLELELRWKEYDGNFEIIKQQFLSHIRQNISETGIYNELFEKAAKIRFDFVLPPFTEDFSTLADSLKTNIAKAFEQSKQQLNSLISRQFSQNDHLTAKSKVFLVSGKQDHQSVAGNNKLHGDELLTKIRELLNEISDPKQARLFISKFADLLNKHEISDTYFFNEFIAEIKEAQSQEAFRANLSQLLNQLKVHKFEKAVLGKSVELETKIQHFLGYDRLKKENCESAELVWKNLLELNKTAFKERLMREEEQKYIKSRMIAGLRDLNYDVMTDMEVIDFEKDDNFLLSVPDQENFINVRFDSEGKMLYNFLIPENRDGLTHEQKEARLAEMDETCTQFKEMLGHLKSEGLNIDLKNEILSTEKALVQLPPKYKTWVKKTVSKKGKKNNLHGSRFLE